MDNYWLKRRKIEENSDNLEKKTLFWAEFT